MLWSGIFLVVSLAAALVASVASLVMDMNPQMAYPRVKKALPGVLVGLIVIACAAGGIVVYELPEEGKLVIAPPPKIQVAVVASQQAEANNVQIDTQLKTINSKLVTASSAEVKTLEAEKQTLIAQKAANDQVIQKSLSDCIAYVESVTGKKAYPADDAVSTCLKTAYPVPTYDADAFYKEVTGDTRTQTPQWSSDSDYSTTNKEVIVGTDPDNQAYTSQFKYGSTSINQVGTSSGGWYFKDT